jgi:hypothetical protein
MPKNTCIFSPQKFDVIFINPLFTRVEYFTYLTKVVTIELKRRHVFYKSDKKTARRVGEFREPDGIVDFAVLSVGRSESARTAMADKTIIPEHKGEGVENL